jgi:hypothetical protein
MTLLVCCCQRSRRLTGYTSLNFNVPIIIKMPRRGGSPRRGARSPRRRSPTYRRGRHGYYPRRRYTYSYLYPYNYSYAYLYPYSYNYNYPYYRYYDSGTVAYDTISDNSTTFGYCNCTNAGGVINDQCSAGYTPACNVKGAGTCMCQSQFNPNIRGCGNTANQACP